MQVRLPLRPNACVRAGRRKTEDGDRPRRRAKSPRQRVWSRTPRGASRRRACTSSWRETAAIALGRAGQHHVHAAVPSTTLGKVQVHKGVTTDRLTGSVAVDGTHDSGAWWSRRRRNGEMDDGPTVGFIWRTFACNLDGLQVVDEILTK